MQTRAIGHTAAVFVVAQVRCSMQELVQQIAVCAMDFDAVEARFLRVLRTLSKLFDYALDLFDPERTRHFKLFLRTQQRDRSRRCNRARRKRLFAAQERRIAHAPNVPDLRQNQSTGLMHGGGNGLPKLGLLLAPDARNLRITHAHRRNRRAFRDDHARACTLPVVVDHDWRRQMVDRTAQARQWRHHYAIPQLQRTSLQWLE